MSQKRFPHLLALLTSRPADVSPEGKQRERDAKHAAQAGGGKESSGGLFHWQLTSRSQQQSTHKKRDTQRIPVQTDCSAVSAATSCFSGPNCWPDNILLRESSTTATEATFNERLGRPAGSWLGLEAGWEESRGRNSCGRTATAHEGDRSFSSCLLLPPAAVLLSHQSVKRGFSCCPSFPSVLVGDRLEIAFVSRDEGLMFNPLSSCINM